MVIINWLQTLLLDQILRISQELIMACLTANQKPWIINSVSNSFKRLRLGAVIMIKWPTISTLLMVDSQIISKQHRIEQRPAQRLRMWERCKRSLLHTFRPQWLWKRKDSKKTVNQSLQLKCQQKQLKSWSFATRHFQSTKDNHSRRLSFRSLVTERTKKKLLISARLNQRWSSVKFTKG